MPDRDLTNVQFPMLNSYPNRANDPQIRHPLRLRIAHWELNIGQILGLMSSSEYCQVIFAQALRFGTPEEQAVCGNSRLIRGLLLLPGCFRACEQEGLVRFLWLEIPVLRHNRYCHSGATVTFSFVPQFTVPRGQLQVSRHV